MQIKIDNIDVPDGHRPINPVALEQMIDSIDMQGQLAPIAVFKATPDAKRWTLNFGQHRMVALSSLGLAEVWATERKGDTLALKLAEIDENLCRAELTELERAEQLKARKAIIEQQDKKAGGANSPAKLTDGRKAGPQHAKGFDAQTAAATGMDKSTIRKSRKRADNIADDVKVLIQNTPIANSGVELDALANVTPVKQRKAVAKVLDGKAGSVRKALGKSKPKAKAKAPTTAELVKAWDGASVASRQALVRHIVKTAPGLMPKPKAKKAEAVAAKTVAKKQG